MTLTAPLLALSIIAIAFINRAFPGTLSRNSPATFVFAIAVLAICLLVRLLLKRWLAAVPVPADVATLYGTGGQRLMFFLETAFAVGCIVAAGVLVGTIDGG